jgi:hypothetical protein
VGGLRDDWFLLPSLYFEVSDTFILLLRRFPISFFITVYSAFCSICYLEYAISVFNGLLYFPNSTI